MNVNLDIHSRDLQLLLSAFGRKVMVLSAGAPHDGDPQMLQSPYGDCVIDADLVLGPRILVPAVAASGKPPAGFHGLLPRHRMADARGGSLMSAHPDPAGKFRTS
jgi:hypothetical protein